MSDISRVSHAPVSELNEDYHSVNLANEGTDSVGAERSAKNFECSNQTTVDLDNQSAKSEPKRASRTEISKVANQLSQTIENCSMIHQSLAKDLASQDLEYDALVGFQNQLALAKNNVKHLHGEWRRILGDIEPDFKTGNHVDRVLADNAQLTAQVLNQISKRCVKPKTVELSAPSDLSALNSLQSKPQSSMIQSSSAIGIQPLTIEPALSITETHISKARSKSIRSGTSRASSSVRRLQLETAANLAAMKKKLEATKKTQELERQAQQMAQTIQQRKMQGEIEAEEAKQQVIAQALAEDEVESLLYPPSKGVQPISASGLPDLNVDRSHPVISTQSRTHKNVASSNPASSASEHILRYVSEQQPNPVANFETAMPRPQQRPVAHFEQFVSNERPAVLENAHRDTYASDRSPAASAGTPCRLDTEQQRSTAVTPVPISSDHEAFAETLAEAINTVRQRPSEPPIFYGDPLQYHDWKAAFSEAFDLSRSSPGQKWLKLRQYVDGRALKTVEGYWRHKTEEAYRAAWSKLDKRFGRSEVIADAYESKLNNWPMIKAGEDEKLEDFIDFLESVVGCISTELDLNSKSANKQLIIKLPRQIAQKWTTKATKLEKNYGKFPPLQDFITFLSDECDVVKNTLTKTLYNSQKNESNAKGSKRENNSGKKQNNASVLLANESNGSPMNESKATVDSTSTTSENKNQVKRVKYPCLHCKRDNHTSGECFKLSNLPHSDIEKLFQENKLCFGCAKPGHIKKECKHPESCKKPDCKKQHLTIFHNHYTQRNNKTTPKPAPRAPKQTTTNQSIEKGEQSATVRQCIDSAHKPAQMLSWTIPVYVSTPSDPNNEVLVYALLDSGSSHSFITQNTLSKLNTKTSTQNMNISTLTHTEGTKSTKEVASGLLVRGYRKQKFLKLPPCISQSKIPSNADDIPNSTSVQNWPHLKHLASELISIEAGSKLELGLLIGSNLPQVFISRQDIARGDHEPFARLTDLGWTLMGNTTSEASQQVLANHMDVVVNRSVAAPLSRSNVTFKVKPATHDESLERKILQILSSDFKSTSADETQTLSIDDINFLKTMNEKIRKDSDGYITMPLPLKHEPSKHNNSKSMALNRFKLLQKKFANPTFKEHYFAFMKDIITQGDAELVPESEVENPRSWYIPHFGVYHPKKPGKIRVVFDGSAKVGGMCLNDHLLQGPDQLNSLVGILLRFRREQVGLACDISRMFHQFRVDNSHRDFLRFLWFDSQGDIVAYRMKVHLFGATSSPACATFGLRALCNMSHNKNDSAKHFIRKDFYVDDGLTSVPTTETAKSMVHDAIAICKEGNLRLHKFASNSADFLQSLLESERNIQDIQLLEPDITMQPLERTLGLIWSLKDDSFQFSSEIKAKPSTRRGVLSTIASIYDPLGFLSPFILQGKNILQDMCRSSASWDSPLDDQLLERWEDWKSSLSHLSTVKISRCYKPANFGPIKDAEIHHFCDASTSGYGSVSYLRLVNAIGRVHCSIVMSKARVAPLKPTTIPRLELQAAVTAAQTAKLIKTQLDMEVKEVFWTDSQVVLGYLKNTSKKFHVYVTNRIQQIRELTDVESWFYIPTSINPADHASRGLSVYQLMNPSCSWFAGPEFLHHEPLTIPQQLVPQISPEDPEVKSLVTNAHDSPHRTLYQVLHSCSSWTKAIKIANVFLNKKGSIKNRALEPNAATTYIITSAQQEHFPEVERLMNKKQISRDSKIFNLNPFIDEDGVMRVGGRLKYSTNLDYKEKHPIILPKKSHFTYILLQFLHEKVAHQGRGFTLAKMRSSGYWIVGARALVSSLIHKCVFCRLDRAKPVIPQMSCLPQERSESSPPFSYCGVDCFGPFLVKDRRTELKRYGLMVTCLASRAVHIELLDDLTTSAFINGMRNVIAIRGSIREIWCDQGTNFIGAIPELSKKGLLEFKLNPPSASHMGGAWERMIRTAKNVLRSLMRNHGGRLDTSGLRTLLYEAMAIINSRPLSVVSEEDVPLSPNQLLTMKSDIILPPPSEFGDADMYSRKRWRSIQFLANEFWKRWRSEYLSYLQARQKWVTGNSDAKVGNIVIIKDENTHRNQWVRGKITECISSTDGHTRSVRILLGNRDNPHHSGKYLVRPISKIITIIEAENN